MRISEDAWAAKIREVAEQGKAYGNTTDNQGCVDEGVKRYKEAPGVTSVLSNSIFMPACLSVSRPTPGFCDEVPKQMEFIKAAEWKRKQCREAGLQGDSNCQNLFTPVQQFCEEPYKRPRDNNSNDQ